MFEILEQMSKYRRSGRLCGGHRKLGTKWLCLPLLTVVLHSTGPMVHHNRALNIQAYAHIRLYATISQTLEWPQLVHSCSRECRADIDALHSMLPG